MLLKGLLATIVFALVGTAVMFFCFKLIDRITPGNLSEELLQNKNIALALVVASMILGVSLIISAAIVG
jgi:putative membrane protein